MAYALSALAGVANVMPCLHLSHGVLPRYHRAVIDLAKFSVGCNVMRSNKMCNILFVHAPSASAFLFGEPYVLFRNGRER